MTEVAEGKVFKAVCAVMKDIESIAKDRINSQQGFKFRGIDDVYNMIHDKLAKHGVFSVPEVLNVERSEKTTKSGSLQTVSVMTIKYTFFAEDGSHFSAVVIGEGTDTGDKASNKSMAIAHKYALIQVFAIPTLDSDDPDQTSPEASSHSLTNVTRDHVTSAPAMATAPADCPHVWYQSKFKTNEQYCGKCKAKRSSAA